jgi:CDP-paratose 2-epimerase
VTDDAARLGILEWFRPGEERRVEQAIEQIRAVGIRHLRTGVSWADWMTPGGRNWYAWLLPTLAADLDVLPCFSYTPPSLNEHNATNAPPRRLEDYGDFVCFFIELFGEHFDWVELWNEPDNHREWNAAFDAGYESFATMVGHAGQWSRRLGKRTLLGGLANADPNFLSLMHDRGALQHFDAVGVHGFPFSFEFYWEGWPARVRRLRERLDWCGRPDLPIWITEAGYSTWRHDEAEQLGTFLDALAAPVDRVYWYSLADLDPDLPTVDGFHSDEREYHFGLRASDGREKLLSRLLAAGGPVAVRQMQERLASQPQVSGEAVLVLGGCGRQGVKLLDDARRQGRQVVVIDDLSGERSSERAEQLADDGGVQLLCGSVLDERLVREQVAAAGEVHHAAFARVDASATRAFDVDLQGVRNLLETLRRLDDPPTTTVHLADTWPRPAVAALIDSYTTRFGVHVQQSMAAS